MSTPEFDFTQLQSRHAQVLSSTLPDILADWLENRAEIGQTLWVWAETEADGLDLTLGVFRRFRSSQSLSIPYDSLPARIVHPVTGNEVYVVSQPDHLDPVVTSMHPDSQGDLAINTPEGKATEDDEVDPDAVSGVTVNAQQNGRVTGQPPAGIVLDCEAPRWTFLTDFLNGQTTVLETEAVHEEKSLNAQITAQLAPSTNPAG
jgi:hypothetical protein